MSIQDQAMSVTTAPSEVQEFLRSTPAHVVGDSRRPSGSGEEIEVVDPSTGDVISHIARGRAEDVDAAVQAADNALRRSSWTNMSPAKRESLLHRLASLIDENIEALAVLESLDNGMPLPLSRNRCPCLATSTSQEPPMSCATWLDGPRRSLAGP